ncbi:MAG TPA: superoxide dismutase family protein [Rhodocyclaceae bacterium]|nr:superoxide dismutase family protein [Rhodocyclaceae bacterium]
MRKTAVSAATLAVALMLSGCLPNTTKPEPVAVAVLDTVGANSIKGRITFGDQDGVTRIFLDLTGLTGEHGFHIHEEADCRAALANVTHGHFNPEKKPHGQHMGDLPNIRSDVYGTMRDAMFVRHVALTGANSVIGRTLIITSNFDDFKSQPDGRSGPAIACGMIKPI